MVTVEDEEDLKDMVRGYKKRADGSTTSYFDREVDPETRAMLDRLKQPKRLDGAQVRIRATIGMHTVHAPA